MAGDDAQKDRPAEGTPRPEGLAPRRVVARDARRIPPIVVQPSFERLEITSHRALIAKQADIVERLHAHPDLAIMLFVNPALALREFGVALSAEMTDHVLHALQHPPALRARRDALEASLTKALGAPPKPNDPAWLATTVFDTLKLAPRDTRGHEPAYVPALPQEVLDRLKVLRPEFRNRRGDAPRRLRGMAVRLKAWHPTARRMDLVTPAPTLPYLDARPETLTLEELYFYKDLHPLAHDLLELGIIRRRAFPIHTGDSYRRVKAGEKPNAFRAWVTALRFPTIREERDRANGPPAPDQPPARAPRRRKGGTS